MSFVDVSGDTPSSTVKLEIDGYVVVGGGGRIKYPIAAGAHTVDYTFTGTQGDVYLGAISNSSNLWSIQGTIGNTGTVSGTANFTV